MNSMEHFTGSRRAIYAALGWCSVGLGLAGAFLPGLPSTVFVIAASYLFTRSSPRLEAWLLSNRLLGPGLRRYRESGGVMPRPAKAAALASMWASIALSSVALIRVSLVVVLGTVALGVAGSAVILWRVPTIRPKPCESLPSRGTAAAASRP